LVAATDSPKPPQAANARDIAHFANHFGYTAQAAPVCAACAALMGIEAGQVRAAE
jgi:hypothetical protein